MPLTRGAPPAACSPAGLFTNACTHPLGPRGPAAPGSHAPALTLPGRIGAPPPSPALSPQLHAPPGGSTSFSLAWGMEPAPAPSGGRGGVRAAPAAEAYYAPPPPVAAHADYPPASAPQPSPYGAYAPAQQVHAPSYAAPAAMPFAAMPQPTAAAAAPVAPAPAVTGVTCSSNAYATGSNQNCGACAARWAGGGAQRVGGWGGLLARQLFGNALTHRLPPPTSPSPHPAALQATSSRTAAPRACTRPPVGAARSPSGRRPGGVDGAD